MAWVNVAARIKFYNGSQTLVGTHYAEPEFQISTTPLSGWRRFWGNATAD